MPYLQLLVATFNSYKHSKNCFNNFLVIGVTTSKNYFVLPNILCQDKCSVTVYTFIISKLSEVCFYM